MVCVYAVVQPPRLLLCVKRTTLEDRRPLVRAAIRALQRGYAQAQVEPDSAVAAVLAETPRADRGQLAAQLDAVSPSFTAGVRAPGELRPDALRRLAPAARRRQGVRLRPGGAGQEPVTRRSTSAAPSRAMRERGTTRSNPAASARRLVSTSTCE